jgi:anti-sigma regulatory factor (Ser/Thr protein kinase)
MAWPHGAERARSDEPARTQGRVHTGLDRSGDPVRIERGLPSRVGGAIRSRPRSHYRAPVLARRFVRQVCAEQHVTSAITDDAALLGGELVANSVRDRARFVDVAVRLDEDTITVTVRDDGHVARLVSQLEGSATTRTFDLVRRLAQSWGVSADRYGQEFWFTLRQPGAESSDSHSGQEFSLAVLGQPPPAAG